MRQLNYLDPSQKLVDKNISVSDLSYLVVWPVISGFIGLLAAFIISLIVSIKRHCFWANSVIVLMLAYPLYRFNLLAWTTVKPVFWRISRTFGNTRVEFTVNGLSLLAIGLLIFFLKQPNTFIENRPLKTN